MLVTCTAARDGAAGYSWQFLASVQDGVLHGERGVRGQANSASFDGTIQSDGSAMLLVQGKTAGSGLQRRAGGQSSPFRFHLKSRFSGSRETGTRVELRPCEAVFTKQ